MLVILVTGQCNTQRHITVPAAVSAIASMLSPSPASLTANTVMVYRVPENRLMRVSSKSAVEPLDANSPTVRKKLFLWPKEVL